VGSKPLDSEGGCAAELCIDASPNARAIDNFNGKTWLNEVREIVRYAEHTVERITPTGPDAFKYQATVIDPVVHTCPWTITFPLRREKFEFREAARHEEDHDLPHLRAMKEAGATKKQEGVRAFALRHDGRPTRRFGPVTHTLTTFRRSFVFDFTIGLI
jgi:hypothetical protein